MDINQYLVTESGRITYDIYQRTVFSSPWLTLPKKAKWPQGMGEAVSNIMWERPYVQTENDWSPVTFNDGTGSTCIPPVDLVQFHQTLRNYYLEHKAVHSPYFCVNDLLYTAKRGAQMAAVMKNLTDQVRLYWIKYNRRAFTRFANKVIVEPGLTSTDEFSGETFPTVEPTSILTNGVLDYFYGMLTLEQGARHALSTQNGRPVYGLITDQFTMRSLIREDDNIREDFRYSSQSDRLLQPLGVSHTYNGFVYMMDEMPPRYTFDADLVEGTDPSSDLSSTDPWVEVPGYVLDTTTNPGHPKVVVNPEWIAAPYQDSYIYVKGAYQLRVPDSITSADQATFRAQNYMGDYRWLNVINDDEESSAYNPDGNQGRFRGVLMAGVEGIAPQVMYVLRHKVCGAILGLVDCPA